MILRIPDVRNSVPFEAECITSFGWNFDPGINGGIMAEEYAIIMTIHRHIFA
jgi:hypothetical protein